MSNRANRILQAWLTTPTSGVLELAKDWRARQSPPIKLSGGLRVRALTRQADRTYGERSGYYVSKDGKMVFMLPKSAHPKPFARRTPVYVAGDFNGWGEAIGQEAWRLTESSLGDDTVLMWTGDAEPFLKNPALGFKFVTEDGHWFDVPADAPNVSAPDSGNRNRLIDADRTGLHLFAFELNQPVDLTQAWRAHWVGGEGDNSVPLRPGTFFNQLKTNLALGATVDAGCTTFRLFAPRAQQVDLVLAPPEEGVEPERVALERSADDTTVWEVALEGNLHGWSYSYRLSGPRDEFGLFDPEQPVLDPYARAALGREGPGLVVDAAKTRRRPDGFKAPAWQDLIICEAHVRDLVAMAPIAMDEAERRTFAGLTKWVESPGFYLSQLGVNCVELQPIQEFDNVTPEEYHWGYMTNNFFAPESSYALDPATGSGMAEFQQLVSAFHRRGIAVVLDVVYNHVGVPGHLMFIDKLYYFNVTKDGDLMNWSGCGNDLRADAAMAKQLIIDSCTHLLETYGVDGFRFDLAELLGADVLKDIEFSLKRVKPDVILIAEPWSFRGHIAGALADSGWASWNDGYRRFLKDYIKGHSSREAFEYHLKGSPWHFAKWPAQTVNYVESHDDRTWIDEISENEDGSGHLPTANDRRRTHLMAAVLFSSIGIPMISAGQDFLRSKHGINNTYQRGDLNALDYRRLERFSGTHAYFAEWIAFRRSSTGRLLRHFTRASEGFFQFWWAEDSIAGAVLYNADLSQGREQLLFAINPTMHDVSITIPEVLAAEEWTRVADHERFMRPDVPAWSGPLEASLWLPALGCGLWRTSC
ncbi:alpha-amylase family glycosyl hydrolase [Synoicihabitans lomoniglobus]|uniref:Alpha-amylase family glycosyl hydrolase n=1 Tax=Synoicihabitans lomoniglobus TaxID=2909285 RepID=A0AAF0I6M6_9BACT|nr:glycoside hydrolase family 1 [Opitutaceae bacterium LMO-M01]WED66181.1 alpha-amylase family glycosyl hydrolase [Opitutaceae bacterium LMO-M01]